MSNSEVGVKVKGRLAILADHPAAPPPSDLSSSPIIEPWCVSAQTAASLGGSLTIIDERTGKKYQVPVSAEGTVKAVDLKKITTGKDSVVKIALYICSGVDVYTALAGAVGALDGPLHGGANEAVLKMLSEIGTVENIPEFIEGVKNRKQKMSVSDTLHTKTMIRQQKLDYLMSTLLRCNGISTRVLHCFICNS
ncbi:hypothetical protein SLA2020_329640 [Shorea laevis]